MRDLFAGMKDLFESKGTVCDTGACDSAKACCPEPATCGKTLGCDNGCKPNKARKVRCGKNCGTCDPAACQPAACQQAACGRRASRSATSCIAVRPSNC